MSKNNEKQDLHSENAAKEKTVVKKDIWQTVLVNIIFLAVLVGLYYWNQSGQPLDNFIKQLLGM